MLIFAGRDGHDSECDFRYGKRPCWIMIPRRPWIITVIPGRKRRPSAGNSLKGRSGFWQTGGEVRADELYGRVRDRVPEVYREHLRQCCEGWHTCMGWLDGAREFCHFIKEAGYRIFILSNAADSFYTYFPSFLPLNFFDGIVVSADVRMIKPDPGIYRYLLERYGLKAEECLFVDDVQANVNGAVAVGMQAFRFTGGL